MKAHIHSKGDPSVGINGYDAVVSVDDFDFEDKGHREEVRLDLNKCFSSMFDEKVTVLFDDELEENDYFDNQPDQAQEWYDFDPDC